MSTPRAPDAMKLQQQSGKRLKFCRIGAFGLSTGCLREPCGTCQGSGARLQANATRSARRMTGPSPRHRPTRPSYTFQLSNEALHDMSDLPSESRLQATEAQMRRALGLDAPANPKPGSPGPVISPGGHHRPARRFVRDGEIPVDVIRRDDAAGTNQLDAARQALRSETAVREEAQRLLAEAQEALRDLQTKLAHERMAKDEAVRRLEAQNQASEQALTAARSELLAERAGRQQAEAQAATALERCQAAERQLEEERTQASGTVRARVPVQKPTGKSAASVVPKHNGTPDIPVAVRRRGRPRKEIQPIDQSEFVEWWKPGWKEHYR